MKVKILDNLSYQTLPASEDMIEVDDELVIRVGVDKQFDENGNIVDYVNNDRKIAELTNWFNTTYRYKHEKYTRLIALNKLDDDGVDANKKLLELYEEAEDVRRQIQELEEE